MVIKFQHFDTYVTDTHWFRANDSFHITKNFGLLIFDTGEMIAAKRDLLNFKDRLVLVPLVNVSAL
jgi:hypothetical protein